MCVNWNEPQVSRLQLHEQPSAWCIQTEVSKRSEKNLLPGVRLLVSEPDPSYCEGSGSETMRLPLEKNQVILGDGIHAPFAVAWYMDSFQSYLQIGRYEKQAWLSQCASTFFHLHALPHTMQATTIGRYCNHDVPDQAPQPRKPDASEYR